MTLRSSVKGYPFVVWGGAYRFIAGPTPALLLCILLFVSGCSVKVNSDDKEISQFVNTSEAARKVSDGFTSDLINDRREIMWQKFENEFRKGIDEERFNAVVDQIIEPYGRPLEVEFKQDELWSKTYSDGNTRPVRKFWYAAKTTRHDKGECFLIVEVVPEGLSLAVTTFSIVRFSEGVPPSLR